MYSRIANQMYKISYNKEIPSIVVHVNDQYYWVYSPYHESIWIYEKGKDTLITEIDVKLYKNAFLMRGNPYA